MTECDIICICSDVEDYWFGQDGELVRIVNNTIVARELKEMCLAFEFSSVADDDGIAYCAHVVCRHGLEHNFRSDSGWISDRDSYSRLAGYFRCVFHTETTVGRIRRVMTEPGNLSLG